MMSQVYPLHYFGSYTGGRCETAVNSLFLKTLPLYCSEQCDGGGYGGGGGAQAQPGRWVHRHPGVFVSPLVESLIIQSLLLFVAFCTLWIAV
jgi:hypothetical protein